MAKFMKNSRHETGVVKKEWGGRTPVAVIYPNTYYVGMSNLAIHFLYQQFNHDPKIVAERVFLSEKGKAYSEESDRPVLDFHALAFSFSFEIDYLNIPKILGPDINLFRNRRTERDPILIAGGPATILNPEALSDIFDVIVMGDAEEVMGDIIEALKNPTHKEARIQKLAQIPGIFAPGLNEVGTKRVFAGDLNKYPIHTTVWTDDTEFGHMHLVEVARGCPWKCKFCVTPHIYKPCGFRDKEVIWESIEHGFPMRRHIGLIGSDVLGHPDFTEIASKLIQREIKISVSSLRVNRITKVVASILVHSGHKRATLGIEAGTERLRKLISKDLNDANIFRAIKNLAEAGITNLKLYYMIGLPGEREEDIEGITDMTREIREVLLKERRVKTLAPNISLVVTPFIPKKMTPFADEPFAGKTYLASALKLLRSLTGKIPNTKITGDSVKHAHLEYILSHGGSEISQIIADMQQHQVRFV